jgi:hypothetical protein
MKPRQGILGGTATGAAVGDVKGMIRTHVPFMTSIILGFLE